MTVLAPATPLLALCVCTYNRPTGLAALLASLDRQRLERLQDDHIVLVVVDNSAEGSAAELCRLYAGSGRFTLRAVHEPKKGLVHARNACLAAARADEATHIIFIDDDEAAEPLWLEALYGRLIESGAAAALGPVFPIFERTPPSWLPVHRYVNRVAERGGFAEDGFTCNAIIALSALGEGAGFDPRFNETGGEDTMFFKSLLARGHRIAWAEDARVHEFVPERRMSRRWIFTRWYRTGNVEAHLAMSARPSAAGRLGSLAKGLARLGAGSARIAYALLAHGWRRPDRVTSSFYTACRGAGYVAAAFGGAYKEYARPAYR
ncbi:MULTISPECIES: glycosyltransferase family 2 protein [Rhodomicrobium]|uniref:glycosyltransferase n=1 Tax=Rhodomicrobium TaxID=1068 RepID=UPI000B4B7FF6|nr:MULTISPECIES: glycosyltransferase family 2 protein [Rhodomicrobium]